MNWINNVVRPKIRSLLTTKRELPENLWVKCPDTGEMIYRPDLEAALWVTPAGRHMRIRAPLRFAYTFDGGRYKTIDLPKAPDDSATKLHRAIGSESVGFGRLRAALASRGRRFERSPASSARDAGPA